MKILIIKTGLTETFDLSASSLEVISLGDVLRSTVILHEFRNDEVWWFCTNLSKPLVDGIERISNIVTNQEEIIHCHFDLIINLERDCSVLSQLNVKAEHLIVGYVDSETIATSYEKFQIHSWLNSLEIKELNWSEKLYYLIGKKWSGENYILPYMNGASENKAEFDIGLNWKVGKKWPTKTWPKERWCELETQFQDAYSISWQQGFDDLIEYIKWINNCKIIVTHDSLGLHIALALSKHVIVLFGPTSSVETPMGTKVHALSAAGAPGFDCLPCYKESCHNSLHCMDYLSVGKVTEQLKKSLRYL